MQDASKKSITETSPLRFCRIPRIQLGPESNHSKNVTFQCEGEAYNQLGQRILTYGEQGGILAPNQATPNFNWGRRQSLPLRPDQSVLFFGNSHTRQLLETFLCQYQEDIVDGSIGRNNKDGIGFVRFANNATVHWLTNTWVAFSNNFLQALQLELLVQRPLDSFDVVILGPSNSLSKNIASKYHQVMEKAKANHIDMTWTKTPPTLLHLAELCSSKTTLVGVSMFAPNVGSVNITDMVKHQQLLKKAGRSAVYVVNGRQHIKMVGEGGADNKYGVGVALEGLEGSFAHRCAGLYGGVVDLTVWDIVEVLIFSALPV